jgi:hypothetical protein
MRKLLAVSGFLCLAGEAFGAVRVPMPEPGFPLEFGVTLAGVVGVLFLLRKRKTGLSGSR